MKVEVNRQKVQMVLNWCQTEFGVSKHRTGLPKFRLYKSCGFSIRRNGAAGSYLSDSNNISIFLGSNTTMQFLCKTIIHEYIHYLMDDDEFDSIFKRMVDDGVSEHEIDIKHPHEKICRNTEDICGKRCFEELKYKLYKK